MKTRSNFIVGIDDKTTRIIWKARWQDWPQMVPATQDVIIRHYKGVDDFTEEEWNRFRLKWASLARGVERVEGEDLGMAEMDRLRLAKLKCYMAWNWINILHILHRSTQGMIPGIDIVTTEKEQALLDQERASVQRIIKGDLLSNWTALWESRTRADLEKLAAQIYYESRNGQAWH